MQFSKNVNWQTHTSGDGLWSPCKATVKITRVYLAYVSDVHEFGELRAEFDLNTWSTDKEGLIYTDSAWIEEFRSLMRSLGFTREAVDNINYSEQGMQGRNFVSMDVGAKFMREAEPMYRFAVLKEPVHA